MASGRSGSGEAPHIEAPAETAKTKRRASEAIETDAAHRMQPITYDEAFKAIGGDVELTKYTGLSQQLQARKELGDEAAVLSPDRQGRVMSLAEIDSAMSWLSPEA